jgi:agmatine/peptidylarginine deiminase
MRACLARGCWLALALAATQGCGVEDVGWASFERPLQRDQHGRPILPNWATPEERALGRLAPPLAEDDGKAAPAAGFRVPAEFESARAVLMTYTGYEGLLREISVQVASAGAEVWMVGGPSSLPGVPAAQYRRLNLAYDSVWARDYGPVGIDEASRALGIVDPRYRHWSYRPDDDAIPCRVAQGAGAECHTTTLILDGGNYMTDGRGGVFMTRRIYDWNSGLSEAQVNQLLRTYLGAERLHLFDYARDGSGDPADGTGHIDMFAKLLPDCKVLVAEYAQAPFAAVLDAAAAAFATIECLPGRSYEVVRIPGWYSSQGWWGVWYTYTNSLIVNDAVLVPSYTGGQNAEARAVYEAAMPGYRVVLLNSDEPIQSGGSIHCVTKEIPLVDPAECTAPTDCDLPHTAEHTCQAGVCGVLLCDPGWVDCDGAAPGCETPLGTDQDCAACGDDCRARFPNASGACRAGACALVACAPGFGDCDGEPGNGCEVTLGTDQDCAACGDDCRDDYPHASGGCVAGACQMGACQAGSGDCDGEPGNGCEADLTVEEANCGQCGRACAAWESCQAGECLREACPPGRADCNGVPEDGCEVTLGTDQDCAACGDDCRARFPNASGACRAGACALVACEPGFGDCDGEPVNGCERSLASAEDCGACGRACGPREGCVREADAWVCRADCPDRDGDGFADAACGGSDCDDRAIGVHPGAEERCNLADDDCDGLSDEGGVCDRQAEETSGCGCGLGGGGAGSAWWLLVGLMLLGRRTRP